MNAVTTATKKVADGAWSVACMLVTGSLVMLFVYWLFIQQPPFAVTARAADTSYTVTSGSIVYFESPITPAELVALVSFSGRLVQNGQVKYQLASPDTISREVIQSADAAVIAPTKENPLYALFVPSYVRPGHYTYEVTATYRLNPFKTRRIELPPLNIYVE